jgi:hypothetical protein
MTGFSISFASWSQTLGAYFDSSNRFPDAATQIYAALDPVTRCKGLGRFLA